MYRLFIDTHDRDLIIALYNDDIVVDKLVKLSERNHSDYAMPMIKEILDKNNLNVHNLGEILVINGPGSFTGVRIGVTIAKTLAYTLNIPIKAMSSIDAYAISDSLLDEKVVLIRDIKGVFAGVYKNNELIGELFYKSNSEFEEFIKENNYKNIVEGTNIELTEIIKVFNNIEPTLSHMVNPIYIKVIEALKND